MTTEELVEFLVRETGCTPNAARTALLICRDSARTKRK